MGLITNCISGPLVLFSIIVAAVQCHFNIPGDAPLRFHNVEKRQANQGQNVSGIIAAENMHNVLQAPKPEVQAMDQALLQQESQFIVTSYGGSRSGINSGKFPTVRDSYPTFITTATTPISTCPLPSQPDNRHNEYTCNTTSKYRSLNGTCNNLQNPTWGAAGTCFRRLLLAQYDDGISQMRLSRSGEELPNPRDISLAFNSDDNIPSGIATHMHVMFGQFLDHDISLTPFSRTSNNEAIQCCPISPNNHQQCAPITVRNTDPLFVAYGVNCLPFVRSVLCGSVFGGARQQANQLSAFIDGSHIYGSSQDELNYLRSNSTNGRLAVAENRVSGPLLPRSRDPLNDQCSNPTQNQYCFQAGDQRVNQQPPLTSFHLLFVREHNRIADKLKKINPRWQDEKLFQEARRIVIAELQMIVYNEFLPPLVGDKYMKEFRLWVNRKGNYPDYTTYDPSIDPTLFNEFSTAAFRYGHSMVNSFITEIPSRRDGGHYLRDLFFEPFELSTGKFEHYIRGMADSKAQKCDRHIVPDLTKFLYRRRSNGSGLDLGAFNIQRGRDHGLPGYKQYLRSCLNVNVNSFNDLRHRMSSESLNIIRTLYQSVDDIDFYAGGLAEFPRYGALTGSLFGYILALQFNNLKFGDRYYFEHKNYFTPKQLNELKKTTLAKIICDNTNISYIQRRVMEQKKHRWNKEEKCEKFLPLNLYYWKE